jgi:hypothetical protein
MTRDSRAVSTTSLLVDLSPAAPPMSSPDYDPPPRVLCPVRHRPRRRGAAPHRVLLSGRTALVSLAGQAIAGQGRRESLPAGQGCCGVTSPAS